MKYFSWVQYDNKITQALEHWLSCLMLAAFAWRRCCSIASNSSNGAKFKGSHWPMIGNPHSDETYSRVGVNSLHVVKKVWVVRFQWRMRHLRESTSLWMTKVREAKMEAITPALFKLSLKDRDFKSSSTHESQKGVACVADLKNKGTSVYSPPLMLKWEMIGWGSLEVWMVTCSPTAMELVGHPLERHGSSKKRSLMAYKGSER